MLHLLTLFACTSTSTSNPDTVSASDAPLAEPLDCAAVADSFDAFAPDFDAAIERASAVRLIEANYAELHGLAAIAASSVNSEADRADAAVAASIRLAEAERLTTEFPELAPAIFELDAAEMRTPRAAGFQFDRVSQAHNAAVAAEDAAEDAFYAIELPDDFVTQADVCGFDVPTLPEATFTSDPVGDAVQGNIAEAFALIDAVGLADAAVKEWLVAMDEHAHLSAMETLGDAFRQRLMSRFIRAGYGIDTVVGTAVFNDYPIVNGRFAKLSVVTDGAAPAAERLSIRLPNLGAAALGVDEASNDISTSCGAAAAIDTIEAAIARVEANEAQLAAVRAVLELEAAR